MKIEKDKIEYVANLARMSLSLEEKALFSQQLNDILAYVEKVSEIDTSGIEPTNHAIDMGNVFRDDKPRKSLSNTEALSNAPDKKDGLFRVPKIIE
jgi:aspartyl-tRNA(Asn)/glutamyl-tRNA(Gln) amidotransferase subunit C